MQDSSSASESDSTGVGRSESGRLPRSGRRGLGSGFVTGVGARVGSFSLEATASVSESDRSGSLAFGVGFVVLLALID